MDTRNMPVSRHTRLQYQNSSPHLNSYSQPHGDASSASLLRHHRRDDQDRYEKAEKMKRPSVLKISVITEMTLCILALGFLAFAGLALWMDGHPTGTTQGNQIEEALKVGSTLYTSVFAALLSASLKNIGRYKAQKGTKLNTLWNLMNTNALADPFEHLLSNPSGLVILLLLTWVLSPLGSQSTLRLVYHHNSTNEYQHDIRYWDSGPLGNVFPFSWSCVGNDGAYPVSMRDMYLAALMQGLDAKQGHQDQWGNVKIPRLPDPNSSEADANGWFAAPQGLVDPEQYSSLSGIAIIGLNDLDKKEVNFVVESAYVDLTCSEMKTMPNETMDSELNVVCEDCGETCLRALGRPDRTSAFLGSPFPGLTAAQLANSTITKPRSILFQSTIFSEGALRGIVQTTCQVTQQLVETWVQCIGTDCQATKLRPPTNDHRSANYTSFDYWGGLALDLISRSTVSDKLPVVSGGYIPKGPSTAEIFLNDSNVIPTPSGVLLINGVEDFNLISVGLDVFTKRASTLLNTALQVFMCPSCFSGDFPSNLTLYGPDHTPADGLAIAAKAFNWTIAQAFDGDGQLMNENIPFMAASTNATVRSSTEVYKPHYHWIGMLVGSVVVVFSVGIFGLIRKFQTIIPDVFDPVMGLTYSNIYMPSTSREGILDSEDRVKSASSERVRVGAVEHKEMMARLVFGEETLVSPVDGETLYYEST